jgi:hypothetical protein
LAAEERRPIAKFQPSLGLTRGCLAWSPTPTLKDELNVGAVRPVARIEPALNGFSDTAAGESQGVYGPRKASLVEARRVPEGWPETV